MNDNGERFLTEFKNLCKQHCVVLVEEWADVEDEGPTFMGIHFQGPDFWLPITDLLLEEED